ncbi:MAG: (2Fe-2S)-binding protein [Pseudomonadota bacterium]
MIVCVCRRLNEAAVKEALSAGASSPECVQRHHGKEFNCGKCRSMMIDMIEDHQNPTMRQQAIAAE